MSSLTFLYPTLLWAGLALPLIWWLVRLMPPTARKQSFPALLLLRDLAPLTPPPARTPWWLLLFRLCLLLLLLGGLARPVFKPDTTLPQQGTVIIMVDNGWASGELWSRWQPAMAALCQQAEQEQRAVMVLPTAPEATSGTLSAIGPAAAISVCPLLAKLQPQPWPSNHGAAQELLAETLGTSPAMLYWFNDGLGSAATTALYDYARQNSAFTLYQTDAPLYVLQAAAQEKAAFTATITRAAVETADNLLLIAQDKAGQSLGVAAGTFKPREKSISVNFDLPLTSRNQIARIQIQNSRHAGAVWLVDNRSERHSIGLIGDIVTRREQPLLSGLYYLERGLSARHDPFIGTATELWQRDTAMIINTNDTALSEQETSAMAAWVNKGGVLVQFSGTQLIRDSSLLPTLLRQSQRDLGGVLSWAKPQPLAAFPPHSPFSGLAVPPEVTINQQLLADPAGLTGDTSWALLQDGTPLITGRKMGQGYSVLFHVPAYPGWSNLPLSGVFVQMLERLITMSAGGGAITRNTTTALAPYSILNGFGQLQPAPPHVLALRPEQQQNWQSTPAQPAGYYGSASHGGNGLRAFNLGQAIASPLSWTPAERQAVPTSNHVRELRPWLLGAVLALFIIDIVLSLWLRGLLSSFSRMISRGMMRTVPMIALGLAMMATPATAMEDEDIFRSQKIWLGYITNGAGQREPLAASGLDALAERVKEKTAVEAIGVAAVDLERNELSPLALLYWPLTENVKLSAAAQSKLQDYLARGGMLWLDVTSDPEHNLTLREAGFALPMLQPVTADHALMRTFYLLQECPGRTTTSELWTERDVAARPDNVPTLFIGARDWASAWAANNPADRQSEMAMRCGVNLVLYALTGNYKMDQIHVGTIMKRSNQ